MWGPRTSTFHAQPSARPIGAANVEAAQEFGAVAGLFNAWEILGRGCATFVLALLAGPGLAQAPFTGYEMEFLLPFFGLLVD